MNGHHMEKLEDIWSNSHLQGVNKITLLLLFIFFEHDHTPSGKKMVTGVQMVTASSAEYRV